MMEKPALPSTLLLLLSLSACLVCAATYHKPIFSAQQPFQAAAEFLDRASAGIATLQSWYDNSSGLYNSTGWWNSANALTTYTDFVALNPDELPRAIHVFQNTLVRAQLVLLNYSKTTSPRTGTITHSESLIDALHAGPTARAFPGFINDYYDDEGWWALAWIGVYDIAQNATYLQTAQSIFDDMTGGWSEGTCNGGIWWSKDRNALNAIENELFITVAASLANRVQRERRYFYLFWALRAWNWFLQSGMINQYGTINDGLDITTCQNNRGIVWSYNQGVILGALVELDRALPGGNYLEIAEQIAAAGLAALTDRSGVIRDVCEPECGADGPQFKGVFMRNLRKLQSAAPQPFYLHYIDANADSIWNNDRDPADRLGLLWAGPYLNATAATQSSACDALVAAAAFEGS